jgi:1-acyl-sn-glycerol-3-phosphate acyltransferase
MPDASTSKPARQDSLLSFALERPGHYLWGLFADLAIFFATIVCATTASVLALLTRSGRPIDVIGRYWCRLIVWICGIEIEVEGLEHLSGGRSYVVVSNHLSNFDIWCTAAVVPFWVRFVAKKELLRVPFFGQALALSDHIVIDRQDPESAIERINRAVARTPEGFCILFYAEGTRSPDGKVHEFKKGGVTLALRTGLPIVPMSISGTRKFLPKRCVVIRPGGRVKIVLDRPIETKGLGLEVRDELNARVRDRVVANFIEGY